MNSRVYADLGTPVWWRAYPAGTVLAVLLVAALTARRRPLWYAKPFTLQVVGESPLGAAAGAFVLHAGGGSKTDSTHLNL